MPKESPTNAKTMLLWVLISIFVSWLNFVSHWNHQPSILTNNQKSFLPNVFVQAQEVQRSLEGEETVDQPLDTEQPGQPGDNEDQPGETTETDDQAPQVEPQDPSEDDSGNDVLGGAGVFSTLDTLKKHWSFIPGSDYEYEVIEDKAETPRRLSKHNKEPVEDESQYHQGLGSEGNVLQIKKKEGANQNFDDGVYIQFARQKPKHLTFWCRTTDGEELETCDLRLFHLDKKKSEYSDGSNGDVQLKKIS